MGQMSKWASKEVEIACVREREVSKTPEEEWDYGCNCYESALKAFLSLTKDGHSGSSIRYTQYILNRLIDGKPLTPIYDTPDVWSDISDISKLDGEEVNYQCKRMSSLFKYQYTDGTIKYKDINSHYCIDIDDNSTYSSGIVQEIIDKMFPITMPYWPIDPIKVYCQNILVDRKNGDFDTVGVLYAITPDDIQIIINKFFKEEETNWIEISKREYNQRKELDINGKNKTK